MSSPVSHAFSLRVQAHPLVAELVVPSTGAQVLAVKDELLVAVKQHAKITNFLTLRGVTSQVVTTLLAGLPNPGGVEDIQILRVTLPKKTTIFDLVGQLRAGPLHANPRDVSPNHVLVPAFLGDQCPYGPPRPLTTVPIPNAPPGPSEQITVIDSGYIWDTGWGPNPLQDHSEVTLYRAQWPLHSTNAGFTAPNGWQPGTPDVLDANGDGRLDALAGHANFVAGVIAQHSPLPHITIWNHNGNFVSTSADIPTEAAACRSLIMSHLLGVKRGNPAQVINFSFAFPVNLDVLSTAWDVVFHPSYLGTNKLAPRVVAPAGNQESTALRYPAALNYRYPGKFPNVIGVGSLTSLLAPSSFTNRGQWVPASAIGSEVDSMFLDVVMAVEDDSNTAFPKHDFSNKWASWNGTCFAAPKIAAGIANRLSGNSPLAAWTYLSALGMPDPNNLVGLKFNL